MFLPSYLSYSALSKYEECPRSWYLSYARKAEERQTWY
jgi:ATP-dependent helicase/DNAse subunit B